MNQIMLIKTKKLISIVNSKNRINKSNLMVFTLISCNTVKAIFLGATLCLAQTINITGIVKERNGANVAGATVKLVKSNVSTTTGPDGSFRLTNDSSGTDRNIGAGSEPVILQRFEFIRNRLNISCTKRSFISIHVFNVSGREILSEYRTIQAGTHAISIKNFGEGLHIFKIIINNERYAFKTVQTSISGIYMMVKQDLQIRKVMAKNGSLNILGTTTPIIDTIVVSREGFISQQRYISDFLVNMGTITMLKYLESKDLNAMVIDTAKDFEGNAYPAVRIGNQVWTITNIRSTKYNDGTPIPNVTADSQWEGLTTGAYCYYNNTSDLGQQKKWGALYNWFVVDSASPNNIAPSGWRVPNNADWDELQNYLIANGYNWDGTTVGNKIAKSIAGQTDWISSTTPGSIGNDLGKNNTSGFSALPSGYRGDLGGGFYGQNTWSIWWSVSTPGGPSLKSYYEILTGHVSRKGNGCSIRLLRN